MSTIIELSQVKAIDDFRRWQIGFDSALKGSGARTAWHKLIKEGGCDPNTVKSALYYAAYSLEGAQDCPQEWATYSQARESLCKQSTELKRALRELMSLTVGREPFVRGLLTFYGVKKEYAIFLNKFPTLLDRFERILNTLKLPRQRRHQTRALLMASGEALLHIYVKEKTGKLYPAEAAVLLQAAARSYGLEHLPSYSEEAVHRRYRRFRKDKPNTHEAMQLLVREFSSKATNATLDRFINSREIELFYDSVRDSFDDLP